MNNIPRWWTAPEGFTAHLVSADMFHISHTSTRVGQTLLFNDKATPFNIELVQRRIDECCSRILSNLSVEQKRRIANDLDGIEGYNED